VSECHPQDLWMTGTRYLQFSEACSSQYVCSVQVCISRLGIIANPIYPISKYLRYGHSDRLRIPSTALVSS